MPFFLGADLGATKTHILISDESGCVLGFGESGPGNHETVGYDGMYESIYDAMEQALQTAGLSKKQITGAGLGVAGYDWASEYDIIDQTIRRLGLSAPFTFVNDTVPGLVAGAKDGWGVAVVSGTGCNCRGWDKDHKREGRVTGYGVLMGEGAGGSELLFRTMQFVCYAWTKRIAMTKLANAFIEYSGAQNLEDLIEGYTAGRYKIGAEAAPLVFQVAGEGDTCARDIIRWAGVELGEMTNAVIRQLEFEELAFDVVLTGSMFEGGALLIDPMRETIHQFARKARLVRLTVPPVIGALIIGMEAGGLQVTDAIRHTMQITLSTLREKT